MSEVKVNKISPRIDCGTVTVGDAGDSVTVTAGVPVTVNGDLKSNALKAVDGGSIISQCGTTITLGASGDTINLAAGASQTGFGRTGTVDWDTTAKTASFTAVSGNGYFVNTTSGAVTVTLPATPSAGDIIAVADYANTFGINNLTVANNSEPINGISQDYTADSSGISLTFVYVDGTRGWKNVNDGTTNATGVSNYVIATGGTVTTCGDWKIHTFTSPGTFCVVSAGTPGGSNTADYLVVAGGGGGGAPPGLYSGGGGAGGFRESSPAPGTDWTDSPLGNPGGALPVAVQGYPITVGGGGAVQTSGSNSIFSTITSAGGGNGGRNYPSTVAAGSGGSGGGFGQSPPNSGSAGSGNVPPVSPPQGNPGGARYVGGGGGGGATGAGIGGGSPTVDGGNGGNGAGTGINPSTCVGTPGPSAPLRYFAGGGGGSAWKRNGGTGGYGGGGDGSSGGTCIPAPTWAPQQAGTANTGGGGGSGGSDSGSGPSASSAGGSGIVIIRYKFQN